jgi:hypothetical protein
MLFRILAVLPGVATFALASGAAEAQAPNPQVLGFQAGCFIRHGNAYNVIVKVGPNTASYRFIFTNVANQQVAHDQVIGLLHAGEEVPFKLPNPGTYSFTVKYPPNITNQTAATVASNLTVKPVMVATANGKKVCREVMTLESPSGQKPATR